MIVDTTGPTISIAAPSTPISTVANTFVYTISYSDPRFSQSTLTANDVA